MKIIVLGCGVNVDHYGTDTAGDNMQVESTAVLLGYAAWSAYLEDIIADKLWVVRVEEGRWV